MEAQTSSTDANIPDSPSKWSPVSSDTGTRPASGHSSRFPIQHPGTSSDEEGSTTTDSEDERGYNTDFTTPDTSDSSPEDMQPDNVEDFRDSEYPQLKGRTYLDHGGTTLYAKSLVEEFSADLISNLYGNPHSASSPSALAGHRVDAVRERTLRFFNANPDDYDLIFVANATAAIKLVIECFRDSASASNTPVWYGYHRDAHTSIVGMRESTKMHRCFTSDEEVNLWINSGGLGGPRARQLGLFAYPGQSNMTGRRLPLNWPGRIRKSFHKAPTYTLLDAAALATTAPLELHDPATAPDFVALSFYKIFGFPNIGALIVRKDSAHALMSRKYFGGGTVEMVIAINDNWHMKKDSSLHDRLEDGTLPFHSIFALDHAMTVHERLYGPDPMKFISHHTAQLGRKLYEGISALKHANGLPLCRIYKDEIAVYGDPTMQGATIAFNVQRADGSLVGFEDVEEAADGRNIFVRSGSLCNPGGIATYLNWSPAEMKAAYAAGHRCSRPTQVMLGKPTGVVRVSLGAMSIAVDIQVLLDFLTEVYVDRDCDTPVADEILSQSKPFNVPSPVQPPALNIPHSLFVPSSQPKSAHSTTPSTAGTNNNNSSAWEPATTAPPQQHPPQTSAGDKPKNPPFIPSQHVPGRHRKPWEHPDIPKTYSGVGMEIKVREVEGESLVSRSTTPSVKARKFGRSVVNLLRTKSHINADVRYRVPSLPPPSPLPPEGQPSHDSSAHSLRSMDRYPFKPNLETLT